MLIASTPGGENSRAEFATMFPGKSIKSAICMILFGLTLRCHSFCAFCLSKTLDTVSVEEIASGNAGTEETASISQTFAFQLEN